MSQSTFFGAALLILLLTNIQASAQGGCGLVDIYEGDTACCGNLYSQEDHHCGGHGSCKDFCYEGYGECCGASYGSANTIYSQECNDEIPSCIADGGKWDSANCVCKSTSPILIDVGGNGFRLTDAINGVRFQFDPDEKKVQTGWTAAGEDGDAFLVLDRNKNGTIGTDRNCLGISARSPLQTDRTVFERSPNLTRLLMAVMTIKLSTIVTAYLKVFVYGLMKIMTPFPSQVSCSDWMPLA